MLHHLSWDNCNLYSLSIHFYYKIRLIRWSPYKIETEGTSCNLALNIKLLSHACVIVDSVKSHLNLAILVTLTVIYGKEKLFFVEYKFLASKDEKSTFNLFQCQYDKLMLTLEMSFCLLLKRKAKQGCSGLSRVL